MKNIITISLITILLSPSLALADEDELQGQVCHWANETEQVCETTETSETKVISISEWEQQERETAETEANSIPPEPGPGPLVAEPVPTIPTVASPTQTVKPIQVFTRKCKHYKHRARSHERRKRFCSHSPSLNCYCIHARNKHI